LQRGWCHPLTVAQNYMLKPELLAFLITFYLHHNFVISKNRMVVVVVVSILSYEEASFKIEVQSATD